MEHNRPLAMGDWTELLSGSRRRLSGARTCCQTLAHLGAGRGARQWASPQDAKQVTASVQHRDLSASPAPWEEAFGFWSFILGIHAAKCEAQEQPRAGATPFP